MCGIAGWVDWKRDLTKDPSLIEAMGETLAPRGPDAKGTWLTTNCALAHRRLSVMDPANGAQPMIRIHAGNTYVIVYNGEIYNATELRKELKCRGYSFSTSCDTEVVLFATIEWGPDVPEKLNGIFAFAVWNHNEQTVLLIRDRVGVKPLFYSEYAGRLLFGSEPKAILAHPEFQASVNAEGLAELFAIGPARTPGHGIFVGMHELRPGWAMLYSRNGVKQWPYWKLEAKQHSDDLDQTVRAVRELLLDTVERQLISDVPLGTLLSGGLDSSALTAIAHQHIAHNGGPALQTYSVDYIDQAEHFKANLYQPNADRPWIEIMTNHLQTDHHFIEFDTPDLVTALHESMVARDLPGLVDVDSSLMLFCREIKKNITVAISGEAADEVFGGYPWFHREESLQANTFPWSLKLKDRISYLSKQTVDWLEPERYVARRYEEALAEVPTLYGESEQAARMRIMSYLNITRFMPTLLDRKDRMSMRSGLEVRVPFCDHRLIEYVFNVPWEFKTVGDREKGLLRLAVEPYLPEAIRNRKKSPYPKTHNPSYTAAVQSLLFERLADANSPIAPFLDVTRLHELAKSDDPLPWFGQLMAGPQLFAYLYQIDDWLRTYKVSIV
ncbi:MAG: AsnO [Bacillota bacterium]|jgi:asparagine synthase (glutamine-hydrolysing)